MCHHYFLLIEIYLKEKLTGGFLLKSVLLENIIYREFFGHLSPDVLILDHSGLGDKVGSVNFQVKEVPLKLSDLLYPLTRLVLELDSQSRLN